MYAAESPGWLKGPGCVSIGIVAGHHHDDGGNDTDDNGLIVVTIRGCT